MNILERRLTDMAQAIDVRFDRVERQALPTGGSDGMILTKSGPNPFDVEWRPGIHVGPTPPPDPELNQLWVDTSS